METTVVEVKLPNGTTALVRAATADGPGATKTGFSDQFDFMDVTDTLAGLSDAIRSGLVKARPHKATVEVSIDVAIRAGKLTGLVVDGQGKGSLTVTLEWNFPPDVALT